MDMNNKIYVSETEYSRLCRLDGRVDSLVSYIELKEEQDKEYSSLDRETVKRIIGMCD